MARQSILPGQLLIDPYGLHILFLLEYICWRVGFYYCFTQRAMSTSNHIVLACCVFTVLQGINGILADEMGLGKTVQTIATLAHLAEVRQHCFSDFAIYKFLHGSI